MPYLSRWFVKAGMVYFLAALLLGWLLVMPGATERWPGLVTLSPVYFHLFMVGWVTQLIFGVAFWMFPRYSREKPRGNEGWVVLTFWMLNGGLLLRVVAEPLRGWRPEPVWAWMLAVSAWLQWLAGIVFVLYLWPRVKEK